MNFNTRTALAIALAIVVVVLLLGGGMMGDGVTSNGAMMSSGAMGGVKMGIPALVTLGIGALVVWVAFRQKK